MSDYRYREPVNGIPADQLAAPLRQEWISHAEKLS